MGHEKNSGGYSSDFILRIKGGQEIFFRGSIESVLSGRVYNFSDYLEMVLFMHTEMQERQRPPGSKLRTFRE